MTFLGPHAHVGFVVPDLGAACRETGSALGLTWARVRSRVAGVTTPEGAVDVPFVVTYSQQGPPYVELIEAVPGTLWTQERSGEPHHLGFWSEDVSETSRRLSGHGAPWVATCRHEGEDALRWAYHDHSALGLVEVVDVGRRRAIEAWIRGDGD